MSQTAVRPVTDIRFATWEHGLRIPGPIARHTSFGQAPREFGVAGLVVIADRTMQSRLLGRFVVNRFALTPSRARFIVRMPFRSSEGAGRTVLRLNSAPR
jgi:hypothetical protein